MAKLITNLMKQIIELAAFLIVLAGALLGMGAALEEDTWLMLFYVPLGVLAGIMVSTIVLGIPLLALRINENLEEINESLKGRSASD